MAGTGKPPSLESVLESLNFSAEPTFHTLLDSLFSAKFKGPVLLHFDGGIPRVVEFPQPIQVRLKTSA